MFGATKMFAASDSRPTDVVMIEVFGESLKRLKRKLENLEYDAEFISYMPHLTLAFVKEYSAMAYVGSNPFIGQKFITDRVLFSPAVGEKKWILNTGEIKDYD